LSRTPLTRHCTSKATSKAFSSTISANLRRG
jgi:hypothetical protein